MAPVNRGKPSIYMHVPHSSTGHPSGQAHTMTEWGVYERAPGQLIIRWTTIVYAEYTATSSNFNENTKTTQMEELKIESLF